MQGWNAANRGWMRGDTEDYTDQVYPLDIRIGPWRLLELFALEGSIQFKWYDAWIGVFVDVDKTDGYSDEISVYLCLLPCLPIRVRWVWTWRYEGWDDLPAWRQWSYGALARYAGSGRRRAAIGWIITALAITIWKRRRLGSRIARG